MLLVKWHDEAKNDLLEIMAFIAERNQQAALDLFERIERSLEHLPEIPICTSQIFESSAPEKLWFIPITSFFTK